MSKQTITCSPEPEGKWESHMQEWINGCGIPFFTRPPPKPLHQVQEEKRKLDAIINWTPENDPNRPLPLSPEEQDIVEKTKPAAKRKTKKKKTKTFE